GVKWGIDLDGGMAGDGCGDSRAESGKILIQRGFARSLPGLLDDLLEHALQGGALKADGSSLHGEGLRAEGLDLETVPLKFVGDLGENYHLPWFEFHKQGH